ncbi:MAG: flagellar biosynthetic protein FliO [Myxococcota bacterium]
MPVVLQAAELPGGYGAALLQGLLSLGAVCLLAWVLLRWGARYRLGVGGRGRHLEVIERVPLDARRALVLVRVGESVLLLGVGEGAAPRLIKELPPGELPADSVAAERRSFAEVLAAMRGARGADGEDPG